MSKFKFALESALNYRRSIEEREKEMLARAIQKVTAEEKSMAKLNQEMLTFLQTTDMHKTSITGLRQQEAYLQGLNSRIDKQQQKLEKAVIKSQVQRAQVAQAATRRRILERLKEKNLAEHWEALSKAEQKMLDEVGIARFCRKADNYENLTKGGE